jgi:hypothetical protein
MSYATRSIRLVMLALALLFVPVLADAQTNVGQVSGRVTDQSGGALPGAVVTVLKF